MAGQKQKEREPDPRPNKIALLCLWQGSAPHLTARRGGITFPGAEK